MKKGDKVICYLNENFQGEVILVEDGKTMLVEPINVRFFEPKPEDKYGNPIHGGTFFPWQLRKIEKPKELSKEDLKGGIIHWGNLLKKAWKKYSWQKKDEIFLEQIVRLIEDRFPYPECQACKAYSGEECSGVKNALECLYLISKMKLKMRPIGKTFLVSWAERLAENSSHSPIQFEWELNQMFEELKMEYEK